MGNQSIDRVVLEALVAASQTFTKSLEAALSADSSVGETADVVGEGVLSVWDPLSDEPLIVPDPHGTRQQEDWCTITYLGALWAINALEGRGANSAEIREFAVKAGYKDGRAVTAWSKGNGSTRNDEHKGRWITEGGRGYVAELARQQGVLLPATVTEAEMPK